jgi:hypothetical protein
MLKIEIPMGSTYSKVQAVALNFQKKIGRKTGEK